MSGIACFERPCGSLQDQSQASSEGRSEERTLPIATNRDIYRPGLSGERELRGTHRQEANKLTECLAPKNRHNNQPRGAAHNDCTKAEKCFLVASSLRSESRVSHSEHINGFPLSPRARERPECLRASETLATHALGISQPPHRLRPTRRRSAIRHRSDR
jgi:hypothetical protein